MNWKSILGGIAGIGAAPFTGGGSLALLSTLGPAAASIIGGVASKRGQAQTANETLGTTSAHDQNVDSLARDKFAVDAPDSRLKSALRASMASNFTPATTNWAGPGSGLRGQIPTTSGGPGAAMANMDPMARQLSQLVMQDQLKGQQNGGATGGGADSRMIPYPKIGQSSAMDKILGVAGPAMGILGLLGKFKGGGGASNNGMDEADM